jgi:Tol biopolymer transport system component
VFFADPLKNEGFWVGILDLAAGRLLTVSDPLEQVKWSVPVTNVAVPSDDGRRVLYRPSDEEVALRLADLEKGTILTLPKHEGQHAALPTLTGDGKRVVFARPESIWAIDLDTGESKLLARFPGLRLEEGSASADGRRVLFAVRGYDRRQGVYLVEAK